MFELKRLQQLTCAINEPMNCTNLTFLGSSTPLSQLEKMTTSFENLYQQPGVSKEPVAAEKLHACLGYFPDDQLSCYFTITVHVSKDFMISMESTQPAMMDAFSPRCTVVMRHCRCVTGLKDGRLVMWDLANLKPLKRFIDSSFKDIAVASNEKKHQSKAAHQMGIIAVCASRDGQVLVTGDLDGSIKFWNTERQELLASHQLPQPNKVSTTYSDGQICQKVPIDIFINNIKRKLV